MASQTVNVKVQQRGCGSGCGTFIAVVLVFGVIAVIIQALVKYWYVTVPVVVALGTIVLLLYRSGKGALPSKRGPVDAWLNEVAKRLADLGFNETARNTGSKLGGVPFEGDLVLERADGTRFFLTVFADPARASQAEAGLASKAGFQSGIDEGVYVLASQDRVVYLAVKKGGKVDVQMFQETLDAAATAPSPQAALTSDVSQDAPTKHHEAPQPAMQADVLDQLRRLGELHDTGVLSDQEFEAKKAELLGRL
jgi:hypothetical protein